MGHVYLAVARGESSSHAKRTEFIQQSTLQVLQPSQDPVEIGDGCTRRRRTLSEIRAHLVQTDDGRQSYGPLSKRWQRAAKRVIHVRMAASAFSRTRLTGFSAEAAVGALEADLAVEDEFHAIMSRWSKRRKHQAGDLEVGHTRSLH